MTTILEIATQAFAAKLDEGVDAAIAAAVSPLVLAIVALQARVDELEAMPVLMPADVDARVAAALDAVAHLMFSEETLTHGGPA